MPRTVVLHRFVGDAQRFVFGGDRGEFGLRLGKGGWIVLHLPSGGFGGLQFFGFCDCGMRFEVLAEFGDGHFVSVADSGALGMPGTIHGGDF